jgi:hypothetical protein
MKGSNMKIYSVKSVTVIKVSNEPLKLHVHAIGAVSSTGWTHLRLESVASAEGDTVLDYAFEADPPEGISAPVILPAAAGVSIQPKHSVDAIIVSSRTNSITVHASEFIDPSAASAQPQPFAHVMGASQAAQPQFAAGQGPRRPITTLIVGEEGPTWPFTEHHPTFVFAEHSLPFVAAEGISLLNPAEGFLNPALPGGPGPVESQGGPIGSF